MSGPTLRTPFKTLENTTVWAADKVDSSNILQVYAIHDVYKSHTPWRFTNLKDSGGDRLWLIPCVVPFPSSGLPLTFPQRHSLLQVTNTLRACIDTHSLSSTATHTYTHISYAYIHILRYKFVDQYIFVIWIYTYTGIYSYTYKHTRIHTRIGGSMCQQHHKQQIRDRRQQKCNQVWIGAHFENEPTIRLPSDSRCRFTSGDSLHPEGRNGRWAYRYSTYACMFFPLGVPVFYTQMNMYVHARIFEYIYIHIDIYVYTYIYICDLLYVSMQYVECSMYIFRCKYLFTFSCLPTRRLAPPCHVLWFLKLEKKSERPLGLLLSFFISPSIDDCFY